MFMGKGWSSVGSSLRALLIKEEDKLLNALMFLRNLMTSSALGKTGKTQARGEWSTLWQVRLLSLFYEKGLLQVIIIIIYIFEYVFHRTIPRL